jgi:ribose transport system substrate-binding protein
MTLGATALVVSACSGSTSPTTAPATAAPATAAPATAAPATEAPSPAVAEKPCKVGFSVWDMQYEFFQAMEKGTREAAEKAGCTFVLHDEKSDVNEMVTGATALLDEVSVLIISPFKPDALGPIVSAAQAKGIPVIVDDIGGGGTPYDAIVISDNGGGGTLAAEFMDAQIKMHAGASKKVVSIGCPPDAVYAARRNESFEKRIQELGYTITTDLSGNSVAEQGYTVMKDALAKDPDIAGIFSCNDPMVGGASNAIKDAGKDPVKDIVTVGFNADPEAITLIQNGGLSATVAQDPYGMGALTVALAQQILAGQTPKFDNTTDREVYMPVKLVTIDNVAEYVK